MGKKGGFSSQAEAEASYRNCEEEFNALLWKQQLSSKSNKDVLFKDYLIYWFEEVFSKEAGILNLAMKEAVIEGYIRVNPVPETKPYKRKKPNIVILSREKIKILLQAVSKDNWYLEILLGLLCGLRKGEIYGLKFSDFDIEHRSVKISRQIVANPIIKRGAGLIIAFMNDAFIPEGREGTG